MIVLGAMAHGDMGGAADMPAHEMPAHEMPAEHQQSQDRQGQDGQNADCHCSCIDECSVAVAAAILPTAATVRIVIVAAQPRRVLDARASHPPPASADRRLPFANGPPASRLS